MLGCVRSGVMLPFRQQEEGTPRQMIGSEGVLEARVRRTRIDQVGEPELPDESQALKDVGIDEPESELIDADIVPERVAQNLESHARPSCQPFGPADRISSLAPGNFAK